ncbi:MAG TPA: VCBS repeat-containing protein, partial [Ignavibacteria bacterium]|nr:VCBS repeat-containing protein [Ignavibacteria bacterium]
MNKYILLLLLFIVYLTGIANAQTSITFNTKTDFATGIKPVSVSSSDLNGDGKLDLVVANEVSNSVSVFLNTTTSGTSAPSFSIKTDFSTGDSPVFVSIGDLNGDGKPDFVVVTDKGNADNVLVFLNTTSIGASTPSFSKTNVAQMVFGLNSVSIGDLNGDGKLDLAVIESNTLSLLLNTTTIGDSISSFSLLPDVNIGSSAQQVVIGDLNGDGKPDLTITDEFHNEVQILLNFTTTGDSTLSLSGRFQFTTGADPRSVSIGDLNGDGKPDLAVVNGSSNTNSVSVLLNTTTTGASTPSFSDRTDFPTGSFSVFVSIGDLNGDNKPDLAVANSGFNANSVSVLTNTTTAGDSTPTFASKTDFTVGISPRSLSIGDFNGDGKLDLAVPNYGSDNISILINTTIITGINEVINFIPSEFKLKQNYPNPFNPSTNISFSILKESFVTLKIYDVLGKEVAQLVNQQLKTGNYNFSFDAASGSNRIT